MYHSVGPQSRGRRSSGTKGAFGWESSLDIWRRQANVALQSLGTVLNKVRSTHGSSVTPYADMIDEKGF